MEKQKLIKLIDVAAGRKKADLVLKNAKIVDVFQAKILLFLTDTSPELVKAIKV